MQLTAAVGDFRMAGLGTSGANFKDDHDRVMYRGPPCTPFKVMPVTMAVEPVLLYSETGQGLVARGSFSW